ncbi:hypothetical protein ALT_3917 [Aspergillus lentulus]|uniref:Erythromycin biosynthesis protein CIII-like C-terminal domain-containing protein n=1 Tax=Aspergillus lentulus TaxID=293939 RepID=A0AAN4PII8_ASPLE|nr:uncharacterized protein IFM58399_08050 [Aspergillus lentulus]GAQ06596.1 hypothetical protein ALT_3917 [Aspergillus lentulus]GFF47446.1 hypothetical protein IFM58399_08050 [Aspergillus lentulus]GFF71961.1 hypothetical protein IFM62136_08214 [Aspergillus lentulus]GFF93274.1 hypothetical protein IFM47457_09473 [Aspergillus lentulus]GFG14722.1 hypothetical protein IFM61392_08602 [Aspergillus lentulus]
MDEGEKAKVLFLTNSELGQSSVCLAVAHEFLLRPEYDVHIASFPVLGPTVTMMNARAKSLASAQQEATFHPLCGLSMQDAYIQKVGNRRTFNIHRVGLRGAMSAYKSVLINALAPWNGSEYMAVYFQCFSVLQDIQPVVVVVDPLFAPAIDACLKLKMPYLVLSPNTLKDHCQPKLGNFWKFPALCSGYLYPLPLHQVIPNTILVLGLGLAIHNSSELKELKRYRNENELSGKTPGMISRSGDKTPFLVPSKKEYEFSRRVPSNFTLCGPIVRPWDALETENADLARFVRRGPTVLANFGSHVVFNNATARQFAEGIALLLERKPETQILWKLKWNPEINVEDKAFESIRGAIADRRVRITDWLRVEPMSLLMSGHIECIVHHGGSNSFHEAIRAGVPQVILPTWFDTYDFAARVEWLKIGVWANRKTAPAINGKHLGRALIRVLASNDSPRIFANANALAAQLGPQEGRVVACEKIIEVIKAQKKGEDKKDQQKDQAEEVNVQQVPAGNEERTAEELTSQESALGTLNALY